MSAKDTMFATLGMIGILAFPGAVAAKTVRLAWDPVRTNSDGSPIDGDLAGYRLYHSDKPIPSDPTAARAAGVSAKDLGRVESYSGDFAPGRHYFRLTAYDHKGQESGFNVDEGGSTQELVVDLAPEPATVKIEEAPGKEEHLPGSEFKVVVRPEGDHLPDSMDLVFTENESGEPDQRVDLEPLGDGRFIAWLKSGFDLETPTLRYRVESRDYAGVLIQTAIRLIHLARRILLQNEGGLFRTQPTEDGGNFQLFTQDPDLSFLEVELLYGNSLSARARSVSDALIAYDVSSPGNPSGLLKSPAVVTITYPDSDGDGQVDASHVFESNLVMHQWDGGNWIPLGGVVDAKENTVTASVKALGLFGLLPRAGQAGAKSAVQFISPSRRDGHNDAAVFGLDAESVTIADVRGAIVFEAKMELGTAIQWEGVDQAGASVASGIYLARIKKRDGSLAFQRLAVVK